MTAANLPREARALLDAIAQGESDPIAKASAMSPYFILYGGGSFEGMANRDGYNGFPAWPGKDNSHAAGRYQFEPATWRGIVPRFKPGVPDFRNPDDQDWGAWFLAQQDYGMRSGAPLYQSLRAGDIGDIGSVLQPTWTSMSDDTFPDRYTAALATYPVDRPMPAPAPAPAPQPEPAPVPAPEPAPIPEPAPVPIPAPAPPGPPPMSPGTVTAELLARAPWWMVPGLATMVLMIFGGLAIASCFIDNDTLRTHMFDTAASMFTLMVGYFFGSSAGSQKKDDMATVKAMSSPPSP